jgi:prophage maintenance system killer protein
MAAFVFLKLNGVTLDADESIFEPLVLKAAQGQIDKPTIAEVFRKHSRQKQ